jgi:hypothetical protein
MADFNLPDLFGTQDMGPFAPHVNGPVTSVTGRFMAHTHRSIVARAFMAADLHLGVTQLVAPTVTQSAHIARVNLTYWASSISVLMKTVSTTRTPARAPC